MIGIPFHSEAVASVAVGGRGVSVAVRVVVGAVTAVNVFVGIGVVVGWAEFEQAARTRTSK
jgi:pheromone shutdown protein TraB